MQNDVTYQNGHSDSELESLQVPSNFFEKVDAMSKSSISTKKIYNH
jgi:hypothetical protein